MDAETITNRIILRHPTADDGMDVHRLIRQCKPLDENSIYCNLLHCSHFAETTVVATKNGKIIAFATGYLLPERKDTLFIWQIAVNETARGQNLAKRLLHSILLRPVCEDVSYLESSVMPGNKASLAVFKSVAKELGTGCEESVMFEEDKHFKGRHETEVLLRIGPFSSPKRKEYGT
ncbi:MAG: diaminobutyrate acetyltransferase [Gammaproteobacteria bacterium]|nr:diaminobutyrate acetyltransferase [Gammaproteobacteria bacterium]